SSAVRRKIPPPRQAPAETRARDRSPRAAAAPRKFRPRSAARPADRRTFAARRESRRARSLFRLYYLDAVLQTIRALGDDLLALSEAAEDLCRRLAASSDGYLARAGDAAGSDDEYFVSLAVGHQRRDRNHYRARMYTSGDLSENHFSDAQGSGSRWSLGSHRDTARRRVHCTTYVDDATDAKRLPFGALAGAECYRCSWRNASGVGRRHVEDDVERAEVRHLYDRLVDVD